MAPPNLRLEMKRGDTLPALRATLTDDGAPVDLTAATTIRVLLRRGSTLVINRVVTGTDQGVVTMPWQTGDTAIAGILRGEVEVTWPDGKVQTWPPTDTFTVEISADLGP